MSYPQPAKQAAAYAYNQFQFVTFTIGTEAADTIRVTCQLKDARGNNVARIVNCKVYLSSSNTGSPITPTACTSAIAVGTKGAILNTLVSGKMVDVVTNSSGQFDLDLIQTATPTYYMVVVLPDGGIIVSDAITFA